MERSSPTKASSLVFDHQVGESEGDIRNFENPYTKLWAARCARFSRCVHVHDLQARSRINSVGFIERRGFGPTENSIGVSTYAAKSSRHLPAPVSLTDGPRGSIRARSRSSSSAPFASNGGSGGSCRQRCGCFTQTTRAPARTARACVPKPFQIVPGCRPACRAGTSRVQLGRLRSRQPSSLARKFP